MLQVGSKAGTKKEVVRVAHQWHNDCLTVTVLLGSAFGPKSMRRLLRRCGLAEEARLADDELVFEALHEACHHDKKVRAAVVSALDGRFRTALGKSAGMSAEAVMGQARERAWPLAQMWAAVRSDREEMRRLGRPLAHLVMARAMQGLAEHDQLRRSRERAESAAVQNDELRRRLAEAERENKRLALRVRRLAAVPPPVAEVQAADISPLKNELRQLRRDLDKSRADARRLEDELAAWRGLALSAGRESRGGECPRRERCRAEEQAEPTLIQCPDGCPGDPGQCPLAGRRVAVVGGLKRLEQGYREVVSRLGGRCECHSGRIHAGGQGLRNLVQKSDVVVCITSVNSHGAMNMVKKQCKLCQKRFCPMSGAGVSSLESLLLKVTG